MTVLVLAGLLVLLDRGAALLAERAVADQAQRGGQLSQRPEVELRGFPFLTQALAGRYDDVRLRASGPVAGQQVERLDLRLSGVHLPLRDAVSGSVDEVPVDRLAGTVLLSYPFLSEQAPDGLTVSPAGDRLRVEGRTEVLGQTVSAAATSSVRLEGDRVLVRAEEFSTGSDTADDLLARVLGDRYDFSVPVAALPYGLRLTGLRVQPDGLSVDASGGPTVLSR